MKLYNTLSRKKEEFTPIKPSVVKVYTCGLTVYSQPHIGNWVAYIYWDILVRTLAASGYEVERVQNITDVGHLVSDEDAGEDKMLKGALKEGITAWQVAEKYITIANNEAYDQLKLKQPTHMPRATDFIKQQISFVQNLENKGYVYKINDGMYFDTSKITNYGELAKLDIEGLRFGARVQDTGKKNPTDFAVWKFSDPNENRDMEWDSPWGMGFPGWHLECSVMAGELLGDQIDIHTGGIDHIPVHHTNEIAQTEATTGKRFSNYWVHANHLKVDGEKMAKSLGNVYTLADILERKYSLDAFKMLILSKHYRTEGNFTWEILEATQNRLNNYLMMIDEYLFQPDDVASIISNDVFTKSEQSVLSHLQNDLDTPSAVNEIGLLLDIIQANNGLRSSQVSSLISFLHTVNELLNINLHDRKDINEAQRKLIQERQLARNNKDWTKSDELRDQLHDQGIELRDTARKQIWHRL